MDIALRDKFICLWAKYFAGSPLPICFYYTDDEKSEQYLRKPKGRACVIEQLSAARRGEVLAFAGNTVACHGGARYLGFQTQLMPNFEYFLSCGIPGKMEGERYKKSPELVREVMKEMPDFKAPAKYVLFKRWEQLDETDTPAVVIFFDKPDVISGLFTLSGFDMADTNAVIAPFGAGCATIVQYPYLQAEKREPKSVLGMFDVSARPCVESGVFSFATPMAGFERMVANMDESFLITKSWDKVRQRIEKDA